MRSVGLEVYGYAVGVVSLFLGGCSGQRPARTFSGIVFEYVAGGRSTVGVEGGDRESLSGLSRQSIEVPDLCVSRGEITQRQWSAVTGSNPSYFMRCGPDCPVEQVSWFEALRFANTLSARHELQQTYVFEGDTVGWKADADGFRLLTEVEWEHAAGGGTQSRYAGSEDAQEVAWVGEPRTSGSTHPICQKQRNGFGLCDMSGNVWEWTFDAWGVDSPMAPGSTLKNVHPRVLRGGAWNNVPSSASVHNRADSPPGVRAFDLGVRLALPCAVVGDVGEL